MREVEAPDGSEWDVSVMRMIPPKWDAGDAWPMVGRFGSIDEGPVSALLNGILLPMIRYAVALPFAISRGQSSNVIWIEARSEYPVHETYYWTTTADHVVAAVDDIAAGIAAGQTVPRTMRAFYFGTRQTR